MSQEQKHYHSIEDTPMFKMPDDNMSEKKKEAPDGEREQNIVLSRENVLEWFIPYFDGVETNDSIKTFKINEDVYFVTIEKFVPAEEKLRLWEEIISTNSR